MGSKEEGCKTVYCIDLTHNNLVVENVFIRKFKNYCIVKNFTGDHFLKIELDSLVSRLVPVQ
jgi:hypothetical protein